jgi:uncharacterized protein YoxC
MVERWTDERLDRLATVVEAHDAEIGDLRQSVQGLTEAVDRLVTLGTETFAVVREMQAEVRGLQTENRRILDRFFGEESN